MQEILRMPQLEHYVGLSRASIYRAIKEHQFPEPYQLTARAVGWRRAEVDEWLAGRPRVGTENRVAHPCSGSARQSVGRQPTAADTKTPTDEECARVPR